MKLKCQKRQVKLQSSADATCVAGMVTVSPDTVDDAPYACVAAAESGSGM